MDIRIDELECSPRELICTYISDAALYEQLAEECCELGQAALKMARILRNENPTPVELEEARVNFIEEFGDVELLRNVFNVPIDRQQIALKEQRWVNRILVKVNSENEGEN